MADTIEDILSDANKDIQTIMKYNGNRYLRNLMVMAFIEEHKMFLPEGDPPYHESKFNSYDTKGMFWQVCRKLDVYTNKNLKALNRESKFIQDLESLSPQGAKILLAVKDQKLSSLYENITYESLKKVGYFV